MEKITKVLVNLQASKYSRQLAGGKRFCPGPFAVDNYKWSSIKYPNR